MRSSPDGWSVCRCGWRPGLGAHYSQDPERSACAS